MKRGKFFAALLSLALAIGLMIICQSAQADDAQIENDSKAAVTVNGVSFAVEWQDSETARAFQSLLPLTLAMSELNGNEKFAYLASSLPAEAEKVGDIYAGDLMLYGNDCVVLFYESFSASYAYARIGRVTSPTGLAEALGAGNVRAEFTSREPAATPSN